MLTWLLSLIGGPIVGGIIDAYKAKLASMNSQDAKAVELAEAEIKAEIEARAEATKIILAEQGWWVTAMIRPLLAFPIIIYVWKVVVVDIVFGWGSTPVIGGAVGNWAGWIVLAYFGGQSVERVARIFKR